MTGAEVASILGILLTAAGGLYGTWRLAKADKWKGTADQAAVLLTGWQALQSSIVDEVERVKKSCAEEIANLKAEHDADRREWQEEKAAMQEEIELLKAQVAALLEVGARPKNARSRTTDR